MRRRFSRFACTAAVLLASLLAGPAAAGEAVVAVAANFLEVAERLAAELERETGHRVILVSGSTGKLYAQIVHGAPFDVFLAADAARPERLEREGRSVPGSRFTYAVGRLALWSSEPDRIGRDGAATLRRGDFRRLAIAHPDLAPYGAAARQVLVRLGLWERFADRIVMGETIGQAQTMVASGNAELGFVALSSLASPGEPAAGSRWEVPAGLHDPIRQDAVLLARAADNPAARGFLSYLRGEGRDLVASYGYRHE